MRKNRMKKNLLFSLLWISASIFAAGEEGTANLGTSNDEGMPHLVKTIKVKTVVKPDVLPSGKDILLTILTKRDDNPIDFIEFISQIDLRDNQIFTDLTIGNKYKADPELSQLFMQAHRALLARTIAFLKEKKLLTEFCRTQYTVTSESEEKIDA